MDDSTTSPQWNATTKLVVTLSLLAISAGLLIKFESIIPPLILVTILAYLLNPVAFFLSTRLHVSWKLAVTLVYGVVILSLLSLLTLGGVGLFQQIQSLINLIQQSLQSAQVYLTEISGRQFSLGPLLLDFRKLDLSVLGNQLFGTLQPLIGQSGTVVTTVASGAANFLGWTVFVLLVSYFVLLESDGLWSGFLQINIPGYTNDLKRMSNELGYIWNAFLRGQILIMTLAAIVYTIILNVLGVNYAVGLALIGGLARFIPYLGSFTLWSTLFLVTFFQEIKPFGLTPWLYALIVVALVWLADAIIDNFVAPNIMARALKVHPAAVLVVAIIGLGLLGILGVIIAAPLLASVQLIGRYFIRKLFDLDPWEGLGDVPRKPSLQQQFAEWSLTLRRKFKID